MLDFILVSQKTNKKGQIEIYPKFVIKRNSKDLMIKGGDFYAVYNDKTKMWSTDEQSALDLMEAELSNYVLSNQERFVDAVPKVQHIWDAETGLIDKWHKYVQSQMRDNYVTLDETICFSNTNTNRDSYASKKLSYSLNQGPHPAYDRIMSTLYNPEERHKIEWAIGSIITGDSKWIQKFIVLYGSAGTGKSTVLNIIQWLFEGYYSVFNAKSLGSSNNSFALEAFRSNPLVAIQHDGDLSRIEDNTLLNSLVSHEEMTVNVKFKSSYSERFKTFLFMGTNKPVKITDSKSGIIRRLIDVSPTGNKIPFREYNILMKKVQFELGAIAYHCKEVYESDPYRYDNYIPTTMLGASNDFYNYVVDSYTTFCNEDEITLIQAWKMYKVYCEDAAVPYPYSQMIFKEELKNYFEEFHEEYKNHKNVFIGFKRDKFKSKLTTSNAKPDIWLKLDKTESVFDKLAEEYPAQYVSKKGGPLKAWANSTTRLVDLNTCEVHYVKLPLNHIVIDFDIKNGRGVKDRSKNEEAAASWPETYAEYSKSGDGIHLHYIYDGDPTKLSSVYGEDIEIKVFNGNSSLRRCLSFCNDLPIAHLQEGSLPLKGEKNNVLSKESKLTANRLSVLIERNLRKEIHPHTKPSVIFIHDLLEEAYNSGLKYDLTPKYYDSVLSFASNSSHNANFCIKMVSDMKFKSDEPSEPEINEKAPIVFFDVEVFPNLFLINWKLPGEKAVVHRMINPRPKEVEELLKYNLIGFNNRRYDNHMLYARSLGFSEKQLFDLSQQIIGEGKGFFGEAYNLSYTDVYDFCRKKQSLKKWEIELGIHHKESGYPWDEPVPEDKWMEIAEYCDNDVIATEAVWNANQSDFMARKILVKVVNARAGKDVVTVNDTTNSLTAKLVFGNDRSPQTQFNYRRMGNTEGSHIAKPIDGIEFDLYTSFDDQNRPVFHGYEYSYGVSTYRGEVMGEGGRVYAEPGMYGNVALLDIASMHPHSMIAEMLFGPVYTAVFKDLVDIRIHIKHGELEIVKTMLGGVLKDIIEEGNFNPDDLAGALKIAINSVYGLTDASFSNLFRDPRNIDNIVAKRGALFMENLRHEVAKRGFIVAHIKTDSIKIPDATPEIINFVMEYGKMYGYTFEHEATYDKMCLVNNAVYIAKYATEEKCNALYGYAPGDNKKKGGKWTATGTQFQHPQVFKRLFSHEPLEFNDYCESKEVKSRMYLDFNEGRSDVSLYEAIKEYRGKKPESLTKKAISLLQEYQNVSDEELNGMIAAGHNLVFVGKVGRFCPVVDGCNGGTLYREQNKKLNAVTGTTGFRWMESEMVQSLNLENKIDTRYFNNLIDAAKETIQKYGDFEWFASDDEY